MKIVSVKRPMGPIHGRIVPRKFCGIRYIDNSCSMSICVYACIELVKEKYEEAHRSKDVAGIKTLDFCIKKKTDHYNNVINA